MFDSKLSILNRQKPNKTAAIVLVMSTLAMPIAGLAETELEADAVIKTEPNAKAKDVSTKVKKVIAPKANQPVTTLGEMSVSAKPLYINSWLTEDSSAKSVQARTELGRLTKTLPIAGSIIDQEELQTVKYVDILREQLSRTPGVSMIRNIRIADGGKSYTNNLLDGFLVQSPLTQNFTFVDQINPADIEQIEITRGPGSVLYPSNAIGGAFNVITKDPSLKPQYSLSQEFGSYDLFRTQGATSGTVKTPINDVGYNASFSSLNSNGFRERTNTERESGSGKLVFHPDDVSKLTLRTEYNDWYQENPGTLTAQQYAANWQKANPATLNFYQHFQYSTNTASYQRKIGSGGELTANFTRRGQTGIDAFVGGGGGSSPTTANQVDYAENNGHTVYRQDFDFIKSRFYTGVDVINGYQHITTWNRKANTFDLTTVASASKYDETQISPFMQYEFSPLSNLSFASLDNLRFNFGLRREDYQQGYGQTYASSGAKLTSASTDSNQLIKKGGLSYEYLKDHVFWFSMADGWLPAGASSFVGVSYPNYGVTPETSLTKQLGIRGFFKDQNLSYDITAYNTHINNYIASVLCSDNPTACPGWAGLAASSAKTTASFSGNPGAITYQGFETSLSYQPHKLIKFGVAHTLNWGVWDSYTSGATKLYGVTAVNVPRHHVNGRITVFPLPGWSAELETDYISSYDTNIQNTNSYQRPMLFNLRTSYKLKNWTFSLQAINLLSTQYSSRVTANAANVQTYNSAVNGTGDGPIAIRGGIQYQF